MKYLEFKEIPFKGKTKKYFIYNRQDSETKLGKIIWYAQWRKYVFQPAGENLIFDNKCLKEIIEKIDSLMLEHKFPLYPDWLKEYKEYEISCRKDKLTPVELESFIEDKIEELR